MGSPEPTEEAGPLLTVTGRVTKKSVTGTIRAKMDSPLPLRQRRYRLHGEQDQHPQRRARKATRLTDFGR